MFSRFQFKMIEPFAIVGFKFVFDMLSLSGTVPKFFDVNNFTR